MKLIKKIIVTGILTMSTACIIACTSKATMVQVTGDVLNIRKEPSTSSSVVAMISKDVKCELIEEEGDWYKIKYKNYTGYISKEYSKKIEDTSSTSQGNNNQTNENNQTGNNSQTNNNEQSAGNTQANNNAQTSNNNQTGTNATDNNQVASNGNDSSGQENGTSEQEIIYKKLSQKTDLKILPLINSSNIASLKKDKEVEFITQMGNWAYVQTSELSGWVKSTLLKDSRKVTASKENGSNTKTPSSQTSSTSSEEKVGYINEEYVNLRKGAGTNYSVVKILTLNTKVTILEEGSEWYKVKYENSEGYISKEFISDTKKTTTRSLGATREELEENNNLQGAETVVISETSDRKESLEAIANNTNATSKSETQKNSEETTNNKNTEKESENKKGTDVVSYAKQFLGCPYVYGGSGAKNNNGIRTFDCSGFTMYVYKNFGIDLPHGATSQSKISKGTKITKQTNLKAGDIVFLTEYGTDKGIGHCGIYIGDGNFIHASTTTYKVIISSLNTTYAGRFYSGLRLL